MKALVVMPEHGEPPGGAYRTAVVPPSAHVTARQTVTYGLGAQNTLTLSSRSGDGCLLSLQRDIVTLSGRRLERQEIPLPPLPRPEAGLAAAGALLVADCPPDRLYEAMLPLT
ncbi:MAG: hypothetical protein LBH95_07990 [Oscillospiraceae bacterium]|jgi:hypothetical protein|nr:hypothetical protein [Oscillospiraceae bacterium]